jgi:tRNA(fMet)-specific endonuclease VapC
MYMLDTNICIDMLRAKDEALLHYLKPNRENLCISAITLAELEHGVARSAYPEENARALAALLVIFKVLSFDACAAGCFGEIKTDLQRQGIIIGPYDLLIAAHAKARDAVLVTNNMREFKRVTGLVLENWAFVSWDE